MANQATVVRIRILIIVLLTLAGVTALLWMTSRRGGPELTTINPPERSTTPVESPHVVSSSPTPPQESIPSPTATLGSTSPNASPSTSAQPSGEITTGVGYVGTLKLIVPVVGVRPDQLLDTFSDARSEGRSHDAIDIPAPLGTPVVAASDGEIIRFFQSEKGGNTIYQFTPDKKLVLYYAHLQGYSDGVAPGKFVKQGEVIGYVGDTGNAGAGNFHLHFSLSIVTDPKRHWEGTNINPYPLLRK